MQPFETIGIPSPDECLGVGGMLVSVPTAVVGIVWLILFAGGPLAFLLIVAAALIGWVSFMYCVVWDGSWPI